MADELQKHGWDTTRASVESGGDGLDIREIGFNTGGGCTRNIELITKYGSSYHHFPSEERLSAAALGFTSTEEIDSGASIIGVKDNSYSTLTGDDTLQELLDDLDTTFDSVILSDGTIAMAENWTCEKDLTIEGDLHIDQDTGNAIALIEATASGPSAILKLKTSVKTWELQSTVDGNLDFYDGTSDKLQITSVGNVIGDLVMPTSAPSNPVAGSFYYDDSGGKLLIYDGTGWDYVTIEDHA